MLRNICFLLFGIFLYYPAAFSQTGPRTISGLVTSGEDGSTLEGVRVYAKGSGAISGSQQDGMFYIQVAAKDSVLVFSRDDLATREVRLTASSEYNVQLSRGQAGQRNSFSPDGSWRAVFQLPSGIEVPVNLDIRADGKGARKVFFHNGEENFEGGRAEVQGDSLLLWLDQFDNELAFHFEDSVLTGVLRRQDNGGPSLPVKARAGISYRFESTGIAPAADLSGTYDISFISDNGKEEKAVGLFRQDGNKLYGTFLRVTGDARYLEGVVQGDQFYLSSFIGSGPVYYQGRFTPGRQLAGESVNARGKQAFSGNPDKNAALPDPYKITYLKNKEAVFDFSFPDIDGHSISLHDGRYKGKVVVVAIGGTWCPNCVDEAAFLAPWYKANHDRGVEIISIQYERQTDPAYVRKVLTRMREKYDIQYEQVFGGLADKRAVAKSLPVLNDFLAFPTTIIIDRKGKVASIHTGYTGPATGKYYQQFVEEFNKEIGSLL